MNVPASCKVWPYAQVIRGAVLGENCSIGSCAIVDGATLGNRVSVGHGAQVHPGTKIGNDVFVGPGVVICNDAWPRTHKRGWHMPERPTVIIEDGASIGANATILPGVIIGAGAMVGAGVTVTKDVPAHHMMAWSNVPVPIGDDAKKVRMRYAGEVVKVL